MAYIADLSPIPYEREFQVWGTLSIGWLSRHVPYPKGSTLANFQDRLFVFCLNPVLRTRGFHTCEFCSSPAPFLTYVKHRDREIGLGAAEIRVIYRNRVYAAPDLIYHYVVEHQYCPPEEFIEAVLQGPLPGSTEYNLFLENWHKVYNWGSAGL
jgi:hypothetical protein